MGTLRLAAFVLGLLASLGLNATDDPPPASDAQVITPAPADAPAATAAPPAEPASATVVLRKNTPIPLRLLETIGSDTHVRGAHFKLEVTDDVKSG
jgi:hypothetical protein